MNKTNARAILNAQARVNVILQSLAKTLTGDELAYFQNYWGRSVQLVMNDGQYGGAPVTRALNALEGATKDLG